MTTATLQDETLEAVHEALGELDRWACQCHAASLKLVQEKVFPVARVARGSCAGVPGQHSWVVLSMDPYEEDAIIVDPTLWSYDDSVEGIWIGTMKDGKHRPHGTGSIWEWGRPDDPSGPVVELTPREPLSDRAKDFLALLGPLDARGWAVLAHAPVEGWPAHEIIPAINDTFPAVVPIDIMGMLTNRNPGGLYLPEEDFPRDG